MQIAVCMTGVNDKESHVIEQLRQKLPEANFYFHTFTNKTHLIPNNFHDRLFTMHYPKWHYHPMQANAIAKHGKFAKYKDKKIMWDELYFGIVPIIQYSDLLKKIPIRFDLFGSPLPILKDPLCPLIKRRISIYVYSKSTVGTT